MHIEIDALDNQTWFLVPLPPGTNVMCFKMDLSNKNERR